MPLCCHRSYFQLRELQRNEAMPGEDGGTRLPRPLITAVIYPSLRQLMEEVMAGLLCMSSIWIWRIHWFGFVCFIE